MFTGMLKYGIIYKKSQNAEKGKRMEYLDKLGQNAVAAKYELQKLSTADKNAALQAAAAALISATDRILEANRIDYERAVANGMSDGLLDRL